MATPPSQRYRRIGFRLIAGAEDTRITLNIRPEDLSRQEPSRTAITQTLGGAWVDSFDRGLATINLSGHCGWRGSFLLSGEDVFRALRETTFIRWHDLRRQAQAEGRDPDGVRLYFVDSLDDISAQVVPRSFMLRRTRSSPLLMRYQMQLVVVDDGTDMFSVADKITAALSNPLRWLAGVTGLTNLLATMDRVVGDGLAVLGAARAGAAQLAGIATTLIGTVTTIARDARGTFDAVTGIPHSLSLAVTAASRNAWHAIAGDPGLTPDQRAAAMAVASTYAEANCALSAVNRQSLLFATEDPLFGAANCSSSSGGREWSTFAEEGASPFSAMFPPSASSVAVSPAAAAALTELRGDPLPLIGQQARVGALMATAAEGITA